jgi:hypothetical protein
MIALPRGRGADLIASSNSLFRNILRISPNGSRFYAGPPISESRKFFENNILDRADKKKTSLRPSRNSSIINILPAKY